MLTREVDELYVSTAPAREQLSQDAEEAWRHQQKCRRLEKWPVRVEAQHNPIQGKFFGACAASLPRPVFKQGALLIEALLLLTEFALVGLLMRAIARSGGKTKNQDIKNLDLGFFSYKEELAQADSATTKATTKAAKAAKATKGKRRA